MDNTERLECMVDGFNRLNEESKDSVLAILQALVFAQNHMDSESKSKPVPENEPF